MKKLSKQSKIKIGVILLAAVFIGCGNEEPKKNYVARVDESYLTKKDIAADLDTVKLQESRRVEYIRNWVETELLYTEAVKEDILDDQVYKRTLEKSKKELAKAFLLQKFFAENEIEYKQQELIDYYNSNKNEFKLFYDSYLYNSIVFNDEDKAILFRTTLIESDWNKAVNVFSGDPSIISEKINILSYDYQVQPIDLLSIIQQLLPNEVSIILTMEPKKYTVVQLIKKYSRDEIPEFEIIKKNVEDRFLTLKKRELLKDFMRQLYLKYKVEIK
ncbi:MAG: peptidylprolyl isomerase [Ignavibacteriales bacterium]|nr:peptidylprolyl isomerase [Ignavibacteriales bacterium]